MTEKALLMGLVRLRSSRAAHEDSLEELGRLAETAGAEILQSNLYELRRPQAATLVGQGQAEEIASQARSLGANLLVFDEDLNPTQSRNLEKICGVKVIDRTGLILDIFARRARSQEGKIQVELAQLRYLLPRLVGKGEALSRLAGGIGTRGPGETKLEVDRRRAREKISALQRQLSQLRLQREQHRQKRAGVPIPMISLIGYTNAGKSTLMNRLTGASVFVEDKLFATLDPTVRRFRLPSGREILIADTVGFVRKLPHQLVEAFRATFEEAGSADLLLHLIDLSHPLASQQAHVVETVLRELNFDRKPTLRVLNKVDRDLGGRLEGLRISALHGDGIPALLAAIEEQLSQTLRRVSLLIPHEAGAEISLLYRTSRVLKRRDTRRGVRLEAEVNDKYFNKFQKFCRA